MTKWAARQVNYQRSGWAMSIYPRDLGSNPSYSPCAFFLRIKTADTLV